MKIYTKFKSQADRASDVRMNLKELYKIALDTRNFEINLFWQRCNYFLVLNSALAIAYLNLQNEALSIPVAGLGMIVCVLWLRVAFGSKFWQERWELCLSTVEKRLITEKKFPPDFELFSMSILKAESEVRKSLKHDGLYGVLDKHILRKPSVTLAMMYLVIAFVTSWALLLVYRVFVLVTLPLIS